tara:strand:+ start:2079 stop:3560 length:1482 start_codon:yes stop_codon:yes gene_type:complete
MEGSTAPEDATPVADTMVERAPVQPNVPDLLRVSPMETSTATDVETSILDPAVKSDSFCRFVFLNKGILHSHSKVTFAVNTDSNERFFPLGIGVASLVQRAALKIGTKTIQEIDGYNYLTAYKTMFVSNEHQLEREQVQSGRVIAHEFRYDDSGSTAGGADNNTKAFTYGLSNGREYSGDVGGTKDLTTPDWADLAGNPVFQIALADLFPMLKQTQLPLYMMREQVSVELTFDPVAKNRICNRSGVATSTPTINTDELKLIADYIYYPQEMMDAYAQQNNTISITHFDYRHSKLSVSAVSTSGTTQIRNLGGAGRIVTKVITGLQADSASDASILNQFHSISPEAHYQFGEAPAAGKQNGSLTVNLKYNDRFLYPMDVTNPARQFHNTAQAEGMVPFVTREEFCAEGVALTSDTFEGYAQNTGDGGDEKGVLGRFNWLAYRLNRNERINSRGIEYFFKYEGLDGDGGSYTQRTWLELAKTTTISGGYASSVFM